MTEGNSERQITWLEKISSPADLRGLKMETLQSLAGEIRHVIAQTTSHNGGHFAPSMGVVELTIALHYVMNTPEDRLVWDVGHQGYPHKLLTGRYKDFKTLRKVDGISGYLRREESPYDAFGAGHASTSLSAAVGMAIARDQRGLANRVVAICGDGSMTGGMCYEALNNLGYLGTDMLIILNDNAMSISPNIGAVSRYFNQMLTTTLYNRSKTKAREVIRSAGTIGKSALKLGHKIEGSIKNLINPEDNFFEKLGIRYLGPVDGHDLQGMIDILTDLRELKGPILLHVKTIKGKGYAYSETDPEKWHADGGGFEVVSGSRVRQIEKKNEPQQPKPPKYQDVFAKTLIELADNDERIVALTAAMSTGTGLNTFEKIHPDRFFDVGIAEAHAVTSAAGMACDGLRPVCAIYSTFLQRAFDQIIHDVALQNLPVTFALDRGGVVGTDGPTHHGVFDLSYLRMIPGLVVMAPRDEQQLRCMMITAAEHETGPIAYRFPRGNALGISLDQPYQSIEIGKGELLKQADQEIEISSRIAILSIGIMADNAMRSAAELEESGFAVSVADMRFIKPIDISLLTTLANSHGTIVTIEDGVRIGGFGSAICETLSDLGIMKNVLRIGYQDKWVEHASVSELYRRHGLDVDGITESIRNYINNSSSDSLSENYSA